MNTPKIRFKGFKDDWEQRKLKNLIEEYKETVDSSCALPILTSSKTEGVILQEEHFGRKQNHDITGYNILPRNYCTYRNRSDGVDFTFNINKCCDKGIISKFYPVFCGKENDTFFISLVLNNSDEVVREIGYTCTGTGQKVLSFLDLQKMHLRVPTSNEQKKIAGFFTGLDDLITLHQRKCDETKQLKKFMLQKMFPKNGEKNPEIRFEGFTDDWEQRKVGEFLTESRESGHKGDIAHKMTVKLWGKGVYEKKETGSANTQYFTRHAGQFIYSKLDFLNCAFGVVPEELENLETTADVPAFDCDGVNPYFMFYTAIQPRFYEKNGMIADGSRKAKRIHADTFLDMPFFVPSLKEQNKIVNLLSELDHLITLHQRKCEKIKELKKFMLQNMFV